MVEQRTHKPSVVGSIPTLVTQFVEFDILQQTLCFVAHQTPIS